MTRTAAAACGFVYCLLAVGSMRAEVIAQWELDGDLTSSTGRAALSAAAAAPAGAPSVTFADVTILGEGAMAAHFSRGTYFRVHPGFAPNGGGAYVNQFTLILDVLFPDRSPSNGWAAILQTNDTNANDGDWFVSPEGGLGINGSYLGSVPAGEWHRLALVVDLVAGTFTSYIDGVKVQTTTDQALDGRFSLYATTHGAQEGFLLFADESGDNAEGFLNSLQVRDRALCDEHIAALGGIASGPLLTTSFPPKICDPPPPPDMAIKEGPYLQWATRTEITVMWETTVPADASVFYRRSGGAWTEATGAAARKIHEVRLGGFLPGETVEYYVRSRLDGEEVASAVSSFQTNPDGSPDFNFVIWGDSHVNPPVFGGLVTSMTALAPEVAMSCGDVVNSGGIYSEWGVGFLSPLKPLAKSVPFYVAIGNHEANSHWFYDYMAQPGNEHWFSFDYAGSHFVIIDTNFPFGPGSEQYRWLSQDLYSDAAQDAKWLFTFHHHPPYSEIVEETIYAQVRMHLVPLFESAGVDMNFTGHIHDYERGIYIPPDTGRRIAYIQTSGAGGSLWDDEFGGDWEQITKVVQYVYHYCEVKIEGETLTLRAIALNGSVIDAFTLTQAPRDGEPPPPPPPPEPGGKAITQWDFDGGDLAATFGPGTLSFKDEAAGATERLTVFGSTAALGILGINDEPAGVMKFPKAAVPAFGFRVTPRAPANGGGDFINNHSLVFDLLIPTSTFTGDLWLSFLQTNPENATDGDLFVRLSTGGIGISGQYQGSLLPNTWHRVAFVCQVDEGAVILHKYIDGAEVGSQDLGGVDGRWSILSEEEMTPSFLLFTDDNGETSSAYVSSVLFADRALSPEEVASLGGPDAGGILAEPCQLGGCHGTFRRGDGNDDGILDIADAVFTLVFLFAGGRSPSCAKAMDANDDGALHVADPVYLLQYLFKDGPELLAPWPGCGEDPTADDLGCPGQGRCG